MTAAMGVIADARRDRCRFGGEFDRSTVECPAFQRARFVAATSYGKPLGTHVACAHLVVGELSTNQFYPRCALGSDLDKMRWLAMMGPGRIQVLRTLNAEFETHHEDSLRQLVAAKAKALADPPDRRSGHQALAEVVRAFITDFSAFVMANAHRIAEIGVSPNDVVERAARVLGDWQHSSRVDLPGMDEQSILRPERLHAVPEGDVVTAASLMISHACDPPSLMLVGSIDHANLDAVDEALRRVAFGAEEVTVDLSAVAFCSVAGLRLLVQASETGNVTLTGIQPHLHRALTAAGLAARAADTRREAVS